MSTILMAQVVIMPFPVITADDVHWTISTGSCGHYAAHTMDRREKGRP